MTQAFLRASVPAPPSATAQDERLGPRLFRVSVDVLRREIESLDLDEDGLAFWSALPIKQVRLVFATQKATRAQLRRMRRGLRYRAIDHLTRDEAEAYWKRCTLRSLSPDIEA